MQFGCYCHAIRGYDKTFITVQWYVLAILAANSGVAGSHLPIWVMLGIAYLALPNLSCGSQTERCTSEDVAFYHLLNTCSQIAALGNRAP